MFQLAIAIRLLVFAIFVACVYGGNLLFVRLEHRKQLYTGNSLCNTVFHFSLLVTYVSGLYFTLV